MKPNSDASRTPSTTSLSGIGHGGSSDILGRLSAPAFLATSDAAVLWCNSAFVGAFDPLSSLGSMSFETVDSAEKVDFVRLYELATSSNKPVSINWKCPGRGPGAPKTRWQCLTVISERDGDAATLLLIESGSDPEVVIFEQSEMSKRLASLGKLAAQVAHELNNPLDGILRYVSLAHRVAVSEEHEKLQKYLSESRTGLLRMVEIISELLEFTRNSDENLRSTSVNEIVEEAIRTHMGAAEANRVVIASDFHMQVMPNLRGSRFFQVVSNLVRNAIDAMPDGGRLTITTAIVDEKIMVEVADSGHGLPEEPDQVFEPFFTTKEPGKGTGIGLAICKDFVTEMGGSLRAKPGKSEGSVFTVLIPIPQYTEQEV